MKKGVPHVNLSTPAIVHCICGPLRLIPHESSVGKEHVFWAIPGGKMVTTGWLRELAESNGWFFHVSGA